MNEGPRVYAAEFAGAAPEADAPKERTRNGRPGLGRVSGSTGGFREAAQSNTPAVRSKDSAAKKTEHGA